MPNIHSSINFALVNIPVTMNPIIKNNDTSFNQLHEKCGSRINYVKYCPKCKIKIKEQDIIKGYEYEQDKYIVFKKEELEKLKPDNDKEIDIISFVPLKDIDPIYFEKSYDIDAVGKGKAYFLFCEALKKSNLVALAKTVIGNKFYYCILRFNAQNIILTTLYFREEVNIHPDEVKNKIDEKELNLAIQLISSLKGKFEPSKYKDEYQDNIKKAIEDKIDGKTIKTKKKSNKKQISDLMEALEKSLKNK
ncbi:MAG: Ku protein [Bacilli bacterium]|jgi:DNA end-binding protein Ku|nr:Ku protein [Bacilli bacterium]